MELEHLVFDLRFSHFPGGAGEGVVGRGFVNVDFTFDAHGFSSLSVWHEAHLEDVPHAARNSSYRIISRTAPAGDRGGADLMRTTYARTHTYRNADPLIAAKNAVDSHLSNSMPMVLSPHLEEALKSSDYNEAYYTQIVEPVTTAVVGLCRDKSLFDRISDGPVQAIGTWTIGKSLDHPKMKELIDQGALIRDVILIPIDQSELQYKIDLLRR